MDSRASHLGLFWNFHMVFLHHSCAEFLHKFLLVLFEEFLPVFLHELLWFFSSGIVFNMALVQEFVLVFFKELLLRFLQELLLTYFFIPAGIILGNTYEIPREISSRISLRISSMVSSEISPEICSGILPGIIPWTPPRILTVGIPQGFLSCNPSKIPSENHPGISARNLLRILSGTLLGIDQEFFPESLPKFLAGFFFRPKFLHHSCEESFMNFPWECFRNSFENGTRDFLGNSFWIWSSSRDLIRNSFWDYFRNSIRDYFQYGSRRISSEFFIEFSNYSFWNLAQGFLQKAA